MRKITIDLNREFCKACGYCIQFCPKKVLEWDSEANAAGYFPAKIARVQDCIGCGSCAVMCPEAVFTIESEDEASV